MTRNLVRGCLIGTSALSLLAGCSPSSEAPPPSQTADSSPYAQISNAKPNPAPSATPSGLDCPIALSRQAGGTVEETPDQIDRIGQRLGNGDASQIASVVDQLRQHHPAASEGDIVNLLITAYCPVIKAKPGMSVDEKRQTLRTFATQARKIVKPA